VTSLLDTIVLRVGQMGFAGTTGIEYRLEANGDWRAVKFDNEKTMEAVGEGKLAPDKLVVLSKKRIGSFPRSMPGAGRLWDPQSMLSP
jgi:hypothetical protein